MDLQQLSSNVQDAREECKCLICWNYMRPPMYQCRNGHTICSKCKALLRANLDGLIVCPTCNIEIENIRCLALKCVAEALQYPCENNFRGCQEIILGSRKLEHERTCDFRPFNCPYSISDCSFAEPILPLVDHLIDCHKFMGNEVEACDYFYSLEAGGNECKLIFEGRPHSLSVSPRTVRNSNDGLIIQRNMAFLFSGGDRKELKLKVSGRIWKKQPHPDCGAS